MKVLLRLGGKRRGTVKYVGPLSGSPGWLGVELDPGEGELFYTNCLGSCLKVLTLIDIV